jgi:hypothetical protein
MIKKMTPDQVREAFQIENDFTPEEEAAVKQEIKCARARAPSTTAHRPRL